MSVLFVRRFNTTLPGRGGGQLGGAGCWLLRAPRPDRLAPCQPPARHIMHSRRAAAGCGLAPRAGSHDALGRSMPTLLLDARQRVVLPVLAPVPRVSRALCVTDSFTLVDLSFLASVATFAPAVAGTLRCAARAALVQGAWGRGGS